MAPGKCSSQSPGNGALIEGISRAGSRQGKGSIPKGLQSRKVSRLLPSPTPKIKQLPRTVRVAPRTFLLRNSLTREAATSSTKRLSMLRLDHEAAAPQAQTLVRCGQYGRVAVATVSAGPGNSAPPLGVSGLGRREERGGASFKLALRAGSRIQKAQTPAHPRDQATGSRLVRPGTGLVHLGFLDQVPVPV